MGKEPPIHQSIGSTVRILYASERPPYPLFLGGAARCAHRLLLALAAGGTECIAAGDAAYAATPWVYPERSRWAALGVRSVANGRLDCGYEVELLDPFSDGLGRLIDGFRPDLVWA